MYKAVEDPKVFNNCQEKQDSALTLLNMRLTRNDFENIYFWSSTKGSNVVLYLTSNKLLLAEKTKHVY